MQSIGCKVTGGWTRRAKAPRSTTAPCSASAAGSTTEAAIYAPSTVRARPRVNCVYSGRYGSREAIYRGMLDKELYGDVFRLAPRLTPLEARAIGSRSHRRPDDRGACSHAAARPRPQEARGHVRAVRGPPVRPSGATRTTRGGAVATSPDAIEQRRVVAIHYLKEAEEMPSERLVEPDTFERVPPTDRPHLGPHGRGRSAGSWRPDALRADHGRVVRAARGLRPPLPRRHGPVRVRATRSRSRVTASSGSADRRGPHGSRSGCSGSAPTTGSSGADPGLPRRGRRAGAGGPAAGDPRSAPRSSSAS